MTGSILSLLIKPTISSNLNCLIRRYTSSSSDVCNVYDLVVVGGGIVGCATAREMLIRHPNLKIAIVEKENALAKHQTGHNSGVIHAGIYYMPGSMKAKLCVEGLKLSYDYLCKKGIPHKKIGKLIVAQNEQQANLINVLFDRGLKNNVPDLQLVDKECISNYEPKCKGVKAIWSPWTGIVNWAEVCYHFAEDFQKMGGQIFLNYEVSGFSEMLESHNEGLLTPIIVQSKNKFISTKYVLTCAGLYSDRLAVMTGCDRNPRIVPFRGEYLLLNENKRHLCTTNIYPVPNPKLPFLGVHFTPRINGEIWLGPNAILALSREGYKWTDINIRDCIEMAKFPGLYKLLFRGPAGVRAQALDNDGKLVDDFVFDSGNGSIGSRVLHCRNAPSPAATSSMAIAKYIADKMENDFKF